MSDADVSSEPVADGRKSIVVGVDGSVVGELALEWAHEEAALRSARLRLVHCWDYPYYGTMDLVGLDEGFRTKAEAAARQTLDQAIERLRAAHPDSTVEMVAELAEGSPGWSLVQASEGAAMVVVGSRGRGGFAGMLLGSVSQTVANHAKVPAVVVHGESPG